MSKKVGEHITLDIIGTEKGYPCNWCGAEEQKDEDEE